MLLNCFITRIPTIQVGPHLKLDKINHNELSMHRTMAIVLVCFAFDPRCLSKRICGEGPFGLEDMATWLSNQGVDDVE